MSGAICRTCGTTDGHHVPSMFDPQGIGEAGHRMATASNQHTDDLRTWLENEVRKCQMTSEVTGKWLDLSNVAAYIQSNYYPKQAAVLKTDVLKAVETGQFIDGTKSTLGILDDFRDEIATKLSLNTNKEETKTEIDLAIGLMRQWLNEDRITDPHKMVTNAELHQWLDKALGITNTEEETE